MGRKGLGSAAASPYLGDAANHLYDPFADWQIAQFGEDAGLPLAEPGADPDGDELSNVEEFVLGGNPLQSSVAPLPTSTASSTAFIYRFTPAIDNGVLLEVQLSTELSPRAGAPSAPAQSWVASGRIPAPPTRSPSMRRAAR